MADLERNDLGMNCIVEINIICGCYCMKNKQYMGYTGLGSVFFSVLYILFLHDIWYPIGELRKYS